MMQNIRERLTLTLLGLLPLHAALVTVLTKVFYGSGQSPWALFAIWKELFLLVILSMALVEIFQYLRQEKDWRKFLKTDRIDRLILLFITIALLVHFKEFNGVKATVYGIKYDIVPLLILGILRRVLWSENFSRRALQVVLGVGVILAIYGLATLFFPMQFFVALGYSDLHSLYVPTDSLAAFQQIGATGIRRIQSTMSGPNQFGLWLLLPFSISLLGLIRCIQSDDIFFFRILNIAQTSRAAFWTYAIFVFLCSTAIVFTFSRTAWVSAFIIVVLAVSLRYSNDTAQKYVVRLLAPFVFGFAIIAIMAPSIVFRSSSTRGHILQPLLGIQHMVMHPLGSGLSAAGPASNRVSDACVFVPALADTTWAADRPNLCVYAGDTQVQPTDRVCTCPFITENWYVQIGVELGIAGLLVFLSLIFTLVQRIRLAKDEAHMAVLFAFFGISLAGMFLHSWEETAVAYTLWVLLAVQLPVQDLKKPV